MSNRRSKSKGRRGNAMVEFAIASVLLTTLFTGTFQFGYSFYVYNSLVTAVRDATRYASVRELWKNSNDRTVPDQFRTDVQNMAVFGTTTPQSTDQPIAPGLATSNVAVAVQYTPAPANKPITVTISVNNYSLDAIFRTFTFNGKPALTMPYLGIYCSTGPTCP
jgi:Flp pilus assembly protein TadG